MCHAHCSAVEARGPDVLELEFQAVVSHWMWILGSRFGSSARAAASLQPVPGIFAAVLQGRSVRPCCQVDLDKE